MEAHVLQVAHVHGVQPYNVPVLCSEGRGQESVAEETTDACYDHQRAKGYPHPDRARNGEGFNCFNPLFTRSSPDVEERAAPVPKAPLRLSTRVALQAEVRMYRVDGWRSTHSWLSGSWHGDAQGWEQPPLLSAWEGLESEGDPHVYAANGGRQW